MKQILKKEAKCFKKEKSARIEVNGMELRKYAGQRMLVKVFALDKKDVKKAKKKKSKKK